ncbi:hypothetical protein Cantr_01116 [Candida viswanathii]|uniref:Uncharacterized protein n=1 Tax=Candida viswanathii TaxID=5486 RepID=A0A367YHU8_9ASCO|nr:hypothetical protein Cantr_01116 [Candida viswanathii]
MLRVFTYDKVPLPVHNERFTYVPVDYPEDIEDALLKGMSEKLMSNLGYELYLENYAVVYQGFIEMGSTRYPGKFVLFRRFIVWYKEESHLDVIRDKVDCPNSQPEFKKMKYAAGARDAYRHAMDSWLADKLFSTVYYFIGATTQEIRMSTVLNGYYDVSTVVDKITSPPLSDYVVMSLITNKRDAKVKGYNDNYNAMFDDNDVILEWFADELPLQLSILSIVFKVAIQPYYDLRVLPVRIRYKDEYELEILMACVTKNYVLSHRELVPGETPPYHWSLMPGSHTIEHWKNMKDDDRVARIFYFTENDRIFFTTLGMGSYYDIAEMVYHFDLENDLELQRALRKNQNLATEIGKPLAFLDRTLQP